MLKDEESHSLKISPQTPVKRRKKHEIQLASPFFSPKKKSGEARQRDALDVSLSKSGIFAASISNANAFSNIGEPVSLLLARLCELKPLLIQEKVADDPWKVLIAVTLLNKTSGKLAIPVFLTIVKRWPTPLDLSNANFEELTAMINHLGTQRVRSKRLITMSKQYLQDPPSMYDLRPSRASSSPQRKSRFFASRIPIYPSTPISHLPGAGTYALDSYRIFCTAHDDPMSQEWKLVMPFDKELIRYLKWKWAFIENAEWSPTKGVIRQITPEYLTNLITELENNAL